MLTAFQSLAITKVSYLQGYELELVFNHQETVWVDLEAELYGEIFEPLKSLAAFQQVAIDPETHTIAWPNGADFAPEFLYQIGQPRVAPTPPQPIAHCHNEANGDREDSPMIAQTPAVPINPVIASAQPIDHPDNDGQSITDNQRADRLAARRRELGIHPGTIDP